MYTFNERVVREALLNAVSHRDYQLGGNIFVRQYSRRIVIENPGGFPWGISVENILDKQSARNNRIANIFQFCGLVERAGQGMNLMYEMAVKEAKPLPDFSGSDPYFIKLTLNGQVFDPKMLALIKKTSDELLEAMTTDDYILLSLFFHRKKYAEIHQSRFEHLSELGLVSFTTRGIELIDNGTILLTNENGIHFVNNEAINEADPKIIDLTLLTKNYTKTPIGCQSTEERLGSDWGAIGTNGRKRQIVGFIAENKESTSLQLAKHTGLTQGYIRKILKELAADGVVTKTGNYRYAAYAMKKNDN